MTKTSNDVCAEALRSIGVTAVDEAISADDYARAKAHMDDIFATLSDVDDIAFDWTVETVPAAAFLPFARAIAGSVCTAYGKDAYIGLYESGVRGLKRLAARELNATHQTTYSEYM